MNRKEKRILEDLLMSKYVLNVDYMNSKKEEIFEIIPELRDTEGFEHKHPHHSYDVWNHTLVALEKSDYDLQERIALLLHDIGKPHCYQDEEVRHFHGHPQKSVEISDYVLTRLGYDEKEKSVLLYLIGKHDTIIDIDEINKNNIDLIKRRLHMQYCDSYAHNPKYVQKRIDKLDEIKEQVENKINEINQKEKTLNNNTFMNEERE